MEDLLKEKVEYASKYMSNQNICGAYPKISAEIIEHVKVTCDV